jgi:tetratricopeptide (TPR) repeat protein
MTQLAYSLCAFCILSGFAVWILKPWDNRTCKWVMLGLETTGIMIGVAGVVISLTGVFRKPPATHRPILTFVRTPEPPPLVVPSRCTLVELKNTMRLYASNPDSLVILLQQKESCWSAWVAQAHTPLDSGIACIGMGLYREALKHLNAPIATSLDKYYSTQEDVLFYRAVATSLKNIHPEKQVKRDLELSAIATDYQALYHKANQFHREGRAEDAIEAYNMVLSIKPDFTEAYLNKGACLQALGQYDEAVAVLSHAIKLRPDRYEPYMNKGVCLADLGKYHAALIEYEAALKCKPNDDEIWYNKGLALYRLHRNEDAIAAFDTALKSKPDKMEAWYNKGVVLSEMKRTDDALNAFDAALKIQPNISDAHCNRAVCLTALGRINDAVAAYQAALALKPDHLQALRNLADLFVQSGRLREAGVLYNTLVSLNPSDPTALMSRARLAAAFGQKAVMLVDLRRAIIIDLKYAALARSDSVFIDYWVDPDFIEIVSQ